MHTRQLGISEYPPKPMYTYVLTDVQYVRQGNRVPQFFLQLIKQGRRDPQGGNGDGPNNICQLGAWGIFFCFLHGNEYDIIVTEYLLKIMKSLLDGGIFSKL